MFVIPSGGSLIFADSRRMQGDCIHPSIFVLVRGLNNRKRARKYLATSLCEGSNQVYDPPAYSVPSCETAAAGLEKGTI